MTKKLYYEDSFKQNFMATVKTCKKVQNLYAIELDQSAFFPGGGGQPRDYGTLNEQKVYGVLEEGEVLYYMMEMPFKVGEIVKGYIDFERRLDFMQQHSGEHILAGIIDKQYGYANVGFHLSEETVTADFDGILNDAQVSELEKMANEAVMRDEPVICHTYTKEQLENQSFRSKKIFDYEARLVTIGKIDCCACCGVHVKTSGQIGFIKILSAQKHRGGTRLTFKCGLRALQDYQDRFGQNIEISRLLSVPIEQVTQGVKNLWEEKNMLKQKVYSIEEKYFESLTKHMETHRPICIVEEGLTPDALRRLVAKLLLKTSWPCLVLTPEENGFKYALGQKDGNILLLCKNLNEIFQGRGGGKEICQGSLKGGSENIKKAFEELVFSSQTIMK